MRRRTKTHQTSKPKIIYSEDYNGYLVFVPHNKQFISELEFLPEKLPRYEVGPGAWIVDPIDLECVKELVFRFFGEYTFVPGASSSSNGGFHNLPTGGASDSDYKTIFKIAGPELSNKFYRMVAQKVHPRELADDHHTSAELNAAWANVKRALWG